MAETVYEVDEEFMAKVLKKNKKPF